MKKKITILALIILSATTAIAQPGQNGPATPRWTLPILVILIGIGLYYHIMEDRDK